MASFDTNAFPFPPRFARDLGMAKDLEDKEEEVLEDLVGEDCDGDPEPIPDPKITQDHLQDGHVQFSPTQGHQPVTEIGGTWT